MAEAKNSFIKSKMNKDLDDRLVPNNEYRDALNVAVSRSEGSDVGALESILGNEMIIDASNIKAQVIGVKVDQTRALAYYFLSDYNGTSQAPLTSYCAIAVFNTSSNSSQVLVSGSWLNFSKKSIMTGISLIEDLLFFTDNRNQPRKINVTKDFGYYTSEDQISVAKFAPYKAPEFIDLRSTAALKPSTMSDASDPLQTTINSVVFSAVNLDTSKYRNGETIPEAQDASAWSDAATNKQGAWCYYENSLANGSVYGKLYNRYAVEDTRGLAPVGFSVISTGVYTSDIVTGTGGATRLKSQTTWDALPGTNTTGFNVKAGGYRDVSGFAGLGTSARLWAKDDSPVSPIAATGNYVEMTSTNQDDAILSAAPEADSFNGYSVRLQKDPAYNGWNGDPDYLTDKFVKFSYRFKYDDNEYSVVAPFSQDVFIPEQEGQFLNDDETKAFVSTVVEFMQNVVNNAVLNIELPSLDVLIDYKIKGIDILFKQSDRQAYQILDSVVIDQTFIDNLNNTNIYQYDYQSTLPIKTLPPGEASRVFDKVPVTTLAQETSGNRVMYGNFVQGKSGQKGLDYYVDIVDKSNQVFEEYPQHSLKQNRNYQVGIILADKFGRQTDIILSNYDNLLDSVGDPQPGSNVFSDYSNVSFNGSVAGWQGDSLNLNFNSLIPESANANNVGGYPGAYAVGNYYTIPVSSLNFPIFFRDLSTQSITATAAQTVFTFNGITNWAVAANTYSVYKNQNDGFVKLTEGATNDYTIADDGSGSPVVTLVTGANVGNVIKFELLFTENNYYKYQTGTTDSTKPLFAEFAEFYSKYFSIGKELAGLFTDYVNIENVDPLPGTNLPTSVELYTNGEVAEKYLFDQTATGRPEPRLLASELPRTYATYDINVDGFYSFRIGIKQQQQDYYNVYLPGIVNGYPINGSILEQGETAFTTLVSDNINKIPRNLQEVGPLQNQFTSDERMFGRVTNTVNVVAGGITYRNTQFDPSSSADDVDLIGTISDVFPSLEFDAATVDKGNPFCIYDFDTKPYVAKISTQLAIGVTEDLFTAPAAGYEYPSVMGLAIFETTPFISQLELFYEATTTGLISDLNYGIQNTTGGINGISIGDATFSESAFSGTRVTSDFFPTSGGQIDPTYNAVLLSAFNYSYGTTNLNATNYATPGVNQRFSLQPGSANGSYKIQTESTFYAGSINEQGTDVEYAGKYLATIRFTNAAGVVVDQTITLQLVNSAPTITPTANPNPTGFPNNEALFLTSNSPKGYNGSAADPSTTGVPGNANWATFDPPGFGWSIQSIQTTSPANPPVITQYTTPATIIQVAKLAANQTVAGDALRFQLNSVNGNANTPGFAYVIVMKLTDTRGASTTTTIGYSVAAATYANTEVAMTYYTSGTGFTNVDTGMTQNLPLTAIATGVNNPVPPRFIGQIQNWTTGDVYISARMSVSPGAGVASDGFAARIGNVARADFPSGGTIGERLDGVNNTGAGYSLYNATVFNCNPQGATGPFEFWTGTFMKLKKFDANDGSPAGNTLINAGVRPGQRNVGGALGSYDFVDCAVVNFAASISGGSPDSSGQLPPNSRTSLVNTFFPRVEFFWSPNFTSTGQAPTASTRVNLASLIDAPQLPFYPDAIGGSNFANSPSANTLVPDAAQGPTGN